MESIPLEMDNIFGDYEDDDDDAAEPRRLPELDEMETDLHSMMNRPDDDDGNAEDNEADVTDNPELLAKLKGMKGASKHVAKRTLPKLDATRLTGERGIATLPKIFKDVPLKGRKHEVEDLKAIMHHLEHWAHRLFPKMTFGEVLERCERLGAKKEVQTYVKKIRLGMPVLPSDMVEDENDEVQRVGEDSPEHNVPPEDDVDDEIESLIREQEEVERQMSQTGPSSAWEVAGETQTSKLSGPSSAWEVVAETQTSKSSQPEDLSSSQKLSDEVKARIERNKRLAMEKRAARLGKMCSQDAPSQVPTQAPSTDNRLTASSTEGLPGTSTSKDQQTFESAIELLEASDDELQNEPEEPNLIMDIDPTSSQDIEICDADKTQSQQPKLGDNLNSKSQESDEEISLSLNDI